VHKIIQAQRAHLRKKIEPQRDVLGPNLSKQEAS
jgi:hypothetical protein